MPTIIIAEQLNAHENLIAVPSHTYEEFLAWQKKIKSVKTFKPTAAEKRALARSRKEFTKGNYITLAELKHELGLNR